MPNIAHGGNAWIFLDSEYALEFVHIAGEDNTAEDGLTNGDRRGYFCDTRQQFGSGGEYGLIPRHDAYHEHAKERRRNTATHFFQ